MVNGYIYPPSVFHNENIPLYVAAYTGTELEAQIHDLDGNPIGQAQKFNPTIVNQNTCDLTGSLDLPSYCSRDGLIVPKVQNVHCDAVDPGCYILRVSQDKSNILDIPFFVRSQSREKHVLLIAHTHTWQAYNEWGGACYYSNRRIAAESLLKHDLRIAVSYLRPYKDPNIASKEHRFMGPLYHAVQLLKSGGFNFDIVSDYEIEKELVDLKAYTRFMIVGHSEYWSSQHMNLVLSLSKKQRLINLSGNTCYSVVGIESDKLVLLREKYAAREFLLGLANKQPLGNHADHLGCMEVRNAQHHWFNSTVVQDQKFGCRGKTTAFDVDGRILGWEYDDMDMSRILPNLAVENCPHTSFFLLASGVLNREDHGHAFIYNHPHVESILNVPSIQAAGCLSDPVLNTLVTSALA